MATRAKNTAEREFDAVIGKRIEQTRKARRMTCKALAHAVGITQQRMFQFEAGARIPPYLLVKAAAVLRVSVLILVQGTSSNS